MRELSGWGRYPRAECQVFAARGAAELRAALAENPNLIVRGNGRSYGDAALNPRATLLMGHADRLLSFDPETGRLEAEAGILLSDLIETFLPRGWFVPVTPGTKFVTLGGMIAADVHGKNHHADGSIGDHIESLLLILADGTRVRCSTTENPELFDATRGGMGLTGVIESAVLKMRRVESAYIRQKTIRTRNLAETMAVFEQSKDWTYSVAWIDCFAAGKAMGRSIVYLGEHARIEELPPQLRSRPFFVKPQRPKRVPIDFPGFALNPWSVSLFNALFYTAAQPGEALIDYDKYFYPLDTILDWNRLYGKRGLFQYQCVLPKAASLKGLSDILALVTKAGGASFLSVLKLLGPGRGMLSFPMEGYTLAMDFHVSDKSKMLLDELDRIVVSCGGRIYLAKDARMTGDTLRQGYGDLAAFERVRASVDPHRKFSSIQSERLGL